MQPARSVADYGAITELPGSLLNRVQFTRYAHRYALGEELARGRRVLEVACGAGGGLGILARSAHSVVGLDFSESVLGRAQAKYGPRIPLVRGDAQAMPFGSATFDAILCFEAVYYLGNYLHFLQESARLLTPEGLLVLCQSNPEFPDFVPSDLSSHYPSAPELAAALRQTGFRPVALFGILPASGRSLVSRLRYLALRSHLIPQSGAIAGLLKRIVYGRLTPLPAELEPSTVESVRSAVTVAPVAADRPDRIHRVLYAHAVLSTE